MGVICAETETEHKGQQHRRAHQELVTEDVAQQPAIQDFVGNSAQTGDE